MRAGLALATVSGIAGILAISATAGAGQQPDFSGTWVVGPEAPPPAPGRPAPLIYGPQFTIVHQDTVLSLTRTINGSPATFRYVLDGSEVTTRMPGRLCEADSGAVWTAVRDGQAISISMIGAVPPNGKPVKMDVKTTLALETPDTLRVEVTARTAAQTAPRTTTTVYKRSGPPPAAPAPVARAQATMAQVEWISGVWTGARGSSTIEERWTPPAGGSMLAISRTLRDGLQAAFEFLCIVERDGGLVYTAMPNGRTPATDFTLTKIDATSATFENPAHDFPKMIRYTKLPDGSLEATISGEGGQKPLTYLFKRQF
jgi:Domain of unknown function (DUF6265)